MKHDVGEVPEVESGKVRVCSQDSSAMKDTNQLLCSLRSGTVSVKVLL